MRFEYKISVLRLMYLCVPIGALEFLVRQTRYFIFGFLCNGCIILLYYCKFGCVGGG
jgi:hypothetical protein